jgi:signal transduction histidine kinase
MWKFARLLRLLIILISILIIVFMHWRSHVVGLFWKEACYRTWAQDIDVHEAMLRGRMVRMLDKPFAQYDSIANRFVGKENDVEGFFRWLRSRAAHDSLIAAGFVWWRDSDTLSALPLHVNIDPSTQRLLRQYADTLFRPEYYHHYYSDEVENYLESLKLEINQKVGFSFYYLDDPQVRTRPGRAKVIESVLGIVWNDAYYQKYILPDMLRQVSADPRAFGLLEEGSNYRISGLCNGMLLVKADSDTIFSLGQVQTEPDSLPVRYSYWAERLGPPLERSPGWRLYLQDRLLGDPVTHGMAIFGDSRHQRAWDLVKLSFPVPWIMFDRPVKIVMVLALSTLVLMIVTQIVARNRQQDFIAHVSHELRTPVAKVKLFAETLRQDRAVSEDKENEYLDTILRESDHLSVLIDNTLNLARLDAGRLKIVKQNIDVADWIAKLLEKHRPGLVASGFDVQLDLEPGLPPLKADPEALELALNNLIDNAVKYSAEHKEIQIRVEKKGKAYVQICVSDRGIGIPSGKRKAIFKRFYRIKPKDREPIAGAGVGLSLVKEIVKRHHGRVWCEAREDGGSIFIVELPVAK